MNRLKAAEAAVTPEELRRVLKRLDYDLHGLEFETGSRMYPLRDMVREVRASTVYEDPVLAKYVTVRLAAHLTLKTRFPWAQLWALPAFAMLILTLLRAANDGSVHTSAGLAAAFAAATVLAHRRGQQALSRAATALRSVDAPARPKPAAHPRRGGAR